MVNCRDGALWPVLQLFPVTGNSQCTVWCCLTRNCRQPCHFLPHGVPLPVASDMAHSGVTVNEMLISYNTTLLYMGSCPSVSPANSDDEEEESDCRNSVHFTY